MRRGFASNLAALPLTDLRLIGPGGRGLDLSIGLSLKGRIEVAVMNSGSDEILLRLESLHLPRSSKGQSNCGD